MLCLDLLPFSILSTFHLEFLLNSLFQLFQILPSILPPASRPTILYILTHLHLHQGQLKNYRSRTFDLVGGDVDLDYRMSSTVTLPDGQDQDDIRVLHVLHGPVPENSHRWLFNSGSVDLSTISKKDGPRRILKSSCTKIEKELGHIPDKNALERYASNFSWEHRTVVKARLRAGKDDGVKLADYLMYVCLDESTGLPLNNLLSGSLVAGAPKVYGGAFVFKKTIDSGEPGDSKIAAYLQSRDDDLDTEENITWLEERILKRLMIALTYRHIYDEVSFAESPDQGLVGILSDSESAESSDDESAESPPH